VVELRFDESGGLLHHVHLGLRLGCGGVSVAQASAWIAYPYRACRAWRAVLSAHGGKAQLIERAEATWLPACGTW